MRRPDAFAEHGAGRRGRFMVLATTFAFSRRTVLADLAIKHRLRACLGTRKMSVPGRAPNSADLTRRTASYVDKMLKGARPADVCLSANPQPLGTLL